jgi:hypothetical protein
MAQSELTLQIAALSDNEAIAVVSALEGLLRECAPRVPSDRAIESELRGLAANLGVAVPDAPAAYSAAEGGAQSRALLAALAELKDTAALVRYAIENRSQMQDAGLLSAPIVMGLVWLVCTSGFKLKIGLFEWRKDGISGHDQAALLKSLLPGVVKTWLKQK